MDNGFNNLDEPTLAEQASCYGLPYGIFGIVCWTFSFSSIFLTYINCPMFSPHRWGNRYEAQGPWMTFITACFILGPAIFTCINCKAEWMMTLVAIGQLTPWSFKIMNDGDRSYMAADEEKQINYIKDEVLNRWNAYSKVGKFMTIPLSLAGWIGMTALSISLMRTEEAVSSWIWSLYLVAAILIILFIYLNSRKIGKRSFYYAIMFILTTLHVIGSHIILARISNNLSGVAPNAGLASSIIFFIGKRLLFLNFH
ncbi:hypothetical protein C1645_750288 [Glomus cerebriforme]|uniref:Uncharacterized protein n=1 Tax=Glomus cerebriforme TaxID=658196 RepID=A0A397TTV3_9GLOM|nr:hypothetical protein C1645_750288 [Glomus cerebriforme]